MSITKAKAWAIFKGEKLGQAEAVAALNKLIKDEFEAYQEFAEEFEFEVAKISVAAQNEAATIQEKHPELLAELQATPMNRWTADLYTRAVGMFGGSKYEQLHLSAMFRLANSSVLLDLAQPAA